jgi:hypothetical protein
LPALFIWHLAQGATTWFPRGSDPNDQKPENVSMGIIFNFATGEVAGFDSFAAGIGIYYNAKIAAINDTTIYFKGGSYEAFGHALDGSIDRVTGKLDAFTTSLDTNKQEIARPATSCIARQPSECSRGLGYTRARRD